MQGWKADPTKMTGGRVGERLASWKRWWLSTVLKDGLDLNWWWSLPSCQICEHHRKCHCYYNYSRRTWVWWLISCINLTRFIRYSDQTLLLSVFVRVFPGEMRLTSESVDSGKWSPPFCRWPSSTPLRAYICPFCFLPVSLNWDISLLLPLCWDLHHWLS